MTDPSPPGESLDRRVPTLPSVPSTSPEEEGRSLLARLGLGEEPSGKAKYLRAILAGLKEATSEQIKQIPIVGPLFAGAGEALLQLSSEEDAEVFEAPFGRLLTLGEQSREELDVLAALATAIYLQQGALLQKLEAAGLPPEPERLAEIALQAALAAHRGRVAREHRYADYRGLEGGTRAEHAASLPLDEVYVLPRLLPEGAQAQDRDRERDLIKRLVDDPDLGVEERVKAEEELAVLTGERWRPKSEERGLGIGEALAAARQAVVLGGPGTGKSTLTRYLARACALGEGAMRERLGWTEPLVPVVLSLAGFAGARGKAPGLELEEFLGAVLEERGGRVLRNAVAAELAAGRALVLLDGVDEIPDSHERFAIVQAVDRFLAAQTSSRVLVTSRPYGYVRLAGSLPHFVLPNFSPYQVSDFLHRWQRAFEAWRHPAAPDPARAEAEAEAMVQEIGRNPKVSELARNPLMLVILALIRHEQTRLPEERVQLYNRAVNTLMDTWNRSRSLAGIDVGGARLPLDRMVRVWAAVAEWTRRTRPTGVMHRAELERKLIEILRTMEFDEDAPEKTAESYLKAAADRAGLLEERGRDVFAFWHPTFEEFLAAVELTTPTARALERLLPLRDDPRWREVILLAVGYVGVVQRDGDTATALVEAIWQRAPGPLESLLHWHLRLAADCIADDVGVKRSLAERVIVRLGEVVRALPYDIFIEAFVYTVRALPRLRPSSAAVQGLEPLLAGHWHWAVRMEACRLLSNVAAEEPVARQICERLLADKDENLRCHAALGLIRAGDNRPEVWAALRRFPSIDTQLQASNLKGGLLQRAPDKVLALLVKFWVEHKFSWDRSQFHRVASLLTELGREDSRIGGNLRRLLAEPGPLYRKAALVQETGLENPAVAYTLFQALMGEDQDRSLQAAKLLVRMGRTDPALGMLLQALKSEDLCQRLEVAEVLFQVGCSDTAVVDTLLEALTAQDPDQEWQFETADLLVRMGCTGSALADFLLQALRGEDLYQRIGAAELLLKMGRTDPPLTDTLLQIVAADNLFRSLEAAELLLKMGCTDPLLADVLLQLLSHRSQYHRLWAAKLLQKMDCSDDRVPEELLSTALADGSGAEEAQELLALGYGEWAIERLAEFVLPPETRTIFRKAMSCQPLDPWEGETLVDLVRPHPEDFGREARGRRLVFDFLAGRLEAARQ